MASPMDSKPMVTYGEVPIPPPYPSPSTLTISTQFSIDSEKHPETPLPPGQPRSSLLLKIASGLLYIRAVALLATISSFTLILIGLVTYEKTKASSVAEIVDPLSGQEIYVEIETKPNVTFAAIGGVNTLLSVLLAGICWRSSKINHVNNVSSAIVCIIGFAGFASTMSACMYMQQNSQLRTTLWEWACDNRNSSGSGLHYSEICTVIDVSWVMSLLQAVFDLLTVLLTAIAFSLWKWRLFSRHGRVGRVF